MLQDITLQETSAGWFSQLIESLRVWCMKRNANKEENYFLIN